MQGPKWTTQSQTEIMSKNEALVCLFSDFLSLSDVVTSVLFPFHLSAKSNFGYLLFVNIRI